MQVWWAGHTHLAYMAYTVARSLSLTSEACKREVMGMLWMYVVGWCGCVCVPLLVHYIQSVVFYVILCSSPSPPPNSN